MADLDHFVFLAMQKDIVSCIYNRTDNSVKEEIENIFTSHPGSETDKKTAVDQAFREVLKGLMSKNRTNNDTSSNGGTANDEEAITNGGGTFSIIAEFEQLMEFVILHTKHKLCTNNLPILLLSDIFETITLEHCEKMFNFVEKNVSIWTSEPFFSNGKHHLLRMCNDILRRLSKSQNTIFCGRIQLFLAQLFPLEEKSALNLMSSFHSENVTIYKKNPSEFSDDIGAENMDTEDGELTPNPVDYSLYVKFWSIQEFFRLPTQCYTNSGWRTLKINIAEVLKVFESHKIEHNVKKSKEKQIEDIKNCFAKYLTNEKLLNLQLNDSTFRRYFLMQVLIIFQYLTGFVKFRVANQVLNDTQLTWIKETTERVYTIIKETPPNGSNFAKTVEHILNREDNWINWKNDGCPSFAKTAQRQTDDKSKERKRKRNIGEDFLNTSNKRIYMGTPELTRLWNLHPDNLESCKAENRLKFLPTLEQYFEDAVEQADPEAGIEEEYKVVNHANFQWRALRLLARRSHHFFTPSATPFKALPEYLSSIIDNLAKDFRKPAIETKVDIKQEPVDPGTAQAKPT